MVIFSSLVLEWGGGVNVRKSSLKVGYLRQKLTRNLQDLGKGEGNSRDKKKRYVKKTPSQA